MTVEELIAGVQRVSGALSAERLRAEPLEAARQLSRLAFLLERLVEAVNRQWLAEGKGEA